MFVRVIIKLIENHLFINILFLSSLLYQGGREGDQLPGLQPHGRVDSDRFERSGAAGRVGVAERVLRAQAAGCNGLSDMLRAQLRRWSARIWRRPRATQVVEHVEWLLLHDLQRAHGAHHWRRVHKGWLCGRERVDGRNCARLRLASVL